MKPKSSPRRFFSLSAIILAGAFASQAAMALTYNWTPTAAGTYSWDDATSNWTSGFPNASADIANLNIDLLGNQTVNLNQAITVGTINLGDTTGATYNTTTIAGNGGSLILQVASGSATIAKTTVGNDVTDAISADIALKNNLIVNNTATAATGGITLSGIISNFDATARQLTKNGAGVLTLSGANSYTGKTILSAGTLKLGAADRISDSSNLEITGGTFDLGGYSETVGTVLFQNNATITNGTLTGNFNNMYRGTVSAVLAGNQGLTKIGSLTGSNTLTLSGANTYTGTTVVGGLANLVLGIAENPGVSGPLGNGGLISMIGGILTYSAANQYDYSSRFITATDNQQYKVDTAGQNVTWATPLSSTGGLIFKQGAGTLTLGAGTHTVANVLMNLSTANTGTISLSNGTILNASSYVVIGGDIEASLGVNANIAALTTAASSTVTINTPRLGVGLQKANTGTFTLGSGGTLNLEGSSGGRALLQVGYSISSDGGPGRTATGTMDLSAGAASLKLSQLVIGQQTSTGQNGANGTLTLSSNAANHLDISGADSVVLIGSQATTNSFAPLTVGTLTIGNLDATSSITSDNNGTAILLGQKLGTSTQSVTGNLNLNGGTLTITTTGSAIGTSGLGTSNLVLGGATGSGMTLKAGASSTTWIQGLTSAKIKTTGVTFDTNGFDITIPQALLADTTDTGGGLTKSGAGTLTLSGVNTYTGNTTVSVGALVLADNAGLKFVVTDASSNKITGAGSATLQGDFTIDTTAVTVTTGSWQLVDTGSKSFTSTFTVAGAGWTETANVWSMTDGGNTWRFYEADGTLTLNEGGPVDDYVTWDNLYAADLSDKNGDEDGDGLSNFQEYAFGLNPISGASVNPITDLSTLKSAGTFSYTRRTGTGLDYTIWVSIDLQDWGAEPVAADQEAGAPVNGVETVLVTLPSIPTESKLFIRVKAE